jgi:hypothetical protein
MHNLAADLAMKIRNSGLRFKNSFFIRPGEK